MIYAQWVKHYWEIIYDAGPPLVCTAASSTRFHCQFGGRRGQWVINSYPEASESEASLLLLLRHTEQGEAEQIIHYSSRWQDARSRDEGATVTVPNPVHLGTEVKGSSSETGKKFPFTARDASKGTLSPILGRFTAAGQWHRQYVDLTRSLQGARLSRSTLQLITAATWGFILWCSSVPSGPRDVPHRAPLAFL